MEIYSIVITKANSTDTFNEYFLTSTISFEDAKRIEQAILNCIKSDYKVAIRTNYEEY